VVAVSINRTRDRAIRAIQAERGVRYSEARAMWEQENPEHAQRYRDARAQVAERARRPPIINVEQFVVDLKGRALADLGLVQAPGVPDARIVGVRVLDKNPKVDHARSTSDGVLKWALHFDVELTFAGTWASAIADATSAPHVADVDATSSVVTLVPAVARVTFHVTAKGNPPRLRDKHATLEWVEGEPLH
jgi:hypothetical protein